MAINGLVKVTKKQIAAMISSKKIIPATQHCVDWPRKSLKPEHQFRPVPASPTICDALPARAEASGIQTYLGGVPPMLWVKGASQDCLQWRTIGDDGTHYLLLPPEINKR